MADLNPAQSEQLVNIGDYLRQQREQLGKPIDDVAAEIFIRTTLIRAIETGDGETLPEPIFIQGFIRRYADALGLDGIEISQAFDVQPANVASMGNSLVTQEPVDPHQPKPAVAIVEKVDSPGKVPLVPLAIAGAFAVVIGGAIALTQTDGLQSQQNNSAETDSTSPDAEDGDALDDVTVGSEEPGQDEDSASQGSLEAPVVVNVNLDDDAWMRVIADGTSVYEGTLAGGSEETWTAEQEIRITTGNAGAVSLSYNGGESNPAGEPGSVETLTFTASN